MLPCSRCTSIILKPYTRLGIASHDVASHLKRGTNVYQNRNYNQLSTEILKEKIVDSFQQNLTWANKQYERVFGIAEIRQIQEKVLSAEQQYVDITEQRKKCQDEIDDLKNSVRTIRDKLESTPRDSDRYLNLFKEEHELSKEQRNLDLQLFQLKEKEQFSLDTMSKLLRQSHELERLRQERAKYWQIISVALTMVGGLITLMTQRTRYERDKSAQLEYYKAQLEHYKTIVIQNEDICHKVDELYSSVDGLSTKLSRLDEKVDNINRSKEVHRTRSTSGQSWVSYIPGLSHLTSGVRYMLGS